MKTGVGEGARTPDHWNHNPVLYQLSYAHQRCAVIVRSTREAGETKHGILALLTELFKKRQESAKIGFAPFDPKSKRRAGGRLLPLSRVLKRSKLFHQTESIPVAPGLLDLASMEAVNGNGGARHAFSRRGHPF